MKKNKAFTDKEELSIFIKRNIPILVKPKRKTKARYANVFTSNNAFNVTIDELTNKLWDKISN